MHVRNASVRHIMASSVVFVKLNEKKLKRVPRFHEHYDMRHLRSDSVEGGTNLAGLLETLAEYDQKASTAHQTR
jgi:hypothetical protein